MKKTQIIIACVSALILLGLIMVYSNTAVARGTDLLMNKDLIRQAFWAALAAGAILVFAHIDYHVLADWSRPIMILTLAALAAVLVFSPPRNHAHRWFVIGSVNIQVSEFAKIAILLYVASFLSRKREILGRFFKGFLPPLLVLGVTFGLILIEPDFGSAALIALVVLAVLIAAGARWRHIFPLAIAALPVLILLLCMKEYRLQRLITFLHPWDDPRGTGHQLVQSLIALGTGGWTGVGLGRGLLQLGFLPESDNDFVFAIIGQETGFVGCLLVLFTFFVLFHAGIRVARSAPDTLGALLAFGITVLIGLQMLINVAVATGSMPTKGISLPFVSSGGSSLLALSVGVGILLNVARHCPRETFVRARGAVPREATA